MDEQQGVGFPSDLEDEVVSSVLRAFGGSENIRELDACILRLRVTVNEAGAVDSALLKKLGAMGVIQRGDYFQAVFGLKSGLLKEKLQQMLDGELHAHTKAIKSYQPAANVKVYSIYAPLSGSVLALEEVPDPVFSAKLMGDGFAIKPTDDVVLAPVKGTVKQVFHTRHALLLEGEDRLEVLIHVGIDTVRLDGQGFRLLVEEGCEVDIGTPLLKVDFDYICRQGKFGITLVVFTNLEERVLSVNTVPLIAGQTIVCTVS
ncbi:MAG: system glucose-specific transporter subunit [Firmicutes bacterium]|nr:system glucose-specific transporter subunit [Bacillota bacterium]